MILFVLTILLTQHLGKINSNSAQYVCIHRFADMGNGNKRGLYGFLQITISALNRDTVTVSNLTFTFLKIPVEPLNYHNEIDATINNMEIILRMINNIDSSDISFQYNNPEKNQTFTLSVERSKDLTLTSASKSNNRMFVFIPHIIDGTNPHLLNVLEFSLDKERRTRTTKRFRSITDWKIRTILKTDKNITSVVHNCQHMDEAHVKSFNKHINKVIEKRISKQKFFSKCDIKCVKRNTLQIYPIHTDSLTQKITMEMSKQFKSNEFNKVQFVTELLNEYNKETNSESESEVDDGNGNNDVEHKETNTNNRNYERNIQKSKKTTIYIWVGVAVITIVLIVLLIYFGIKYKDRIMDEDDDYDPSVETKERIYRE